MANKKIKFIVSPTGKFQLGYNVGEEAEIDSKQADELIEAGYALEVESKKEASKAKLEEEEARKKANK